MQFKCEHGSKFVRQVFFLPYYIISEVESEVSDNREQWARDFGAGNFNARSRKTGCAYNLYHFRYFCILPKCISFLLYIGVYDNEADSIIYTFES